MLVLQTDVKKQAALLTSAELEKKGKKNSTRSLPNDRAHADK